MKMPKIPAVKIPKMRFPSKEKIKRALPVIFGGLSIIGNAVSAYLFVDTTVKAVRKHDELEAQGKSISDIRREVLPMYIGPVSAFAAANACTIGAIVSAKIQISGALAGMAAADYRSRKLKEPEKKIDISRLPKCEFGEVLFYDEYLDASGECDGYYSMSEADWWQAYAEFLEECSCGEASFADFYEKLASHSEVKRLVNNLGSWPYYATWDMDQIFSDKSSENRFVRLVRTDIDEDTYINIVDWTYAPSVSYDYI